jgi:hypothetical protein
METIPGVFVALGCVLQYPTRLSFPAHCRALRGRSDSTRLEKWPGMLQFPGVESRGMAIIGFFIEAQLAGSGSYIGRRSMVRSSSFNTWNQLKQDWPPSSWRTRTPHTISASSWC